MSTYRAHIFPQRQVGQREEVRLKVFDSEGESIALGGSGGLPEGGEVGDVLKNTAPGEGTWAIDGSSLIGTMAIVDLVGQWGDDNATRYLDIDTMRVLGASDDETFTRDIDGTFSQPEYSTVKITRSGIYLVHLRLIEREAPDILATERLHFGIDSYGASWDTRLEEAKLVHIMSKGDDAISVISGNAHGLVWVAPESNAWLQFPIWRETDGLGVPIEDDQLAFATITKIRDFAEDEDREIDPPT